MTASGNQIYFFFIVNIEKIKTEEQNKPRSNWTDEITTPIMFFPEFHEIHGQPTHQPTNDRPLTQ